ncbi:MAG: hypothetical protein ACR2J6_02545, partial [Thermoleophilaceae bacterium]
MEAGTAAPSGTGSKTMGDLVAVAARKHGANPALRHKVGEDWVDVSYSELDGVVGEVGRGLIDLDVQAGAKVA